jgi:hypothetical protein
VLVLVLIVVYSAASLKSGLGAALAAQEAAAAREQVVMPKVVEPPVPPIEDFLSKGERNVFVPVGVPTTGTNVAEGVKSAEYMLVGVSVDPASPKDTMAIIKDKTTGLTHFVKAGEAVGKTDGVVDRIFADRVIVKKQKQEIELR